MSEMARYAYVTKTGKIRTTSVQFSTMIDATLNQTIGALPVSKRAAAMRRLFKEIVKWENVYSIDADPKAVFGVSIQSGNLPLYLHDPVERVTPEPAFKRLPETLSNLDEYAEIFAQDADHNTIGAIYDERFPSVVTFFGHYEGGDSGVWAEIVELNSLAPGKECDSYSRLCSMLSDEMYV